MRYINRKILTAAALALCLTVSAGFTIAYFTDYEAAQGSAAISLGDQTNIHEELEGSNKHITVQNTGDTPVLVRVGIFGDSNVMKEPVDKDGKWKHVGDYWYYTEILEPGDGAPSETSELYVEVEQKDYDFDIIVAHESAQVIYDNDESRIVRPAEDWEYIPGQDQ